mgnify:CR=1 FL=1
MKELNSQIDTKYGEQNELAEIDDGPRVVKTPVEPPVIKAALASEVSNGAYKAWKNAYCDESEKDLEDKVTSFVQKHQATYKNFCVLLKVAILGTTSNAQPERFFSRVTWLSAARRSPKHCPLDY